MKCVKRMLVMIMVVCISLTMIPMESENGLQTVQAATKIKLNKSKMTLVSGQKSNLRVSGTQVKVTWSSSKKSVATVDKKGRVTARKKGSCIVTARVGKKTYKCKVTVVNLSGFKLNKTSVTLKQNAIYSLKIKYTPSNAKISTKDVKWSSSNEAVAEVDEEGFVYTYDVLGTTTITAKIGNRQAKCKITVSKPKVTSITINKKTATLERGKTLVLKVTVKTSNNSKATVTWTTSNEQVATVDKQGKVKAIGEGTATITAKSGGKQVQCRITVKMKCGTVSGTVTYHYNQYRGYVADPKSLVYFIPKDNELNNLSKTVINQFSGYSLSLLSSYTVNGLKKIGIYATKADGYGNFSISHIPVGDYIVYIISNETSTGGWFDAYDDAAYDATDEYYAEVAWLLDAYMDSDLALEFGKAASYHAYAYEFVTVYEGENSTVTHEFPYTYI